MGLRMTKVEKIERDVATLEPDELARFRDWFAAYDAENWDAEIEADVAASRLDPLAEKALANHRAGRTGTLNHSTDPEFWNLYQKLGQSIQRLADRNFRQLRLDPNHPSLRLTPVGRYWSVRVASSPGCGRS